MTLHSAAVELELATQSEDGELCGALSHFEEADACISAINALLQAPIGGDASALESLRVNLQKYQEQPQLLDPHLEPMIQPVICFIRDKVVPSTSQTLNTRDHQLFQLLYFLSKVRGWKTVIRFFTHDVTDLEPVLEFLDRQDSQQHRYWEVKYVSFLWLSLIVMIPFDMSRIDSIGNSKPLVQRLIDSGQNNLITPSKVRDGAALLLARLLTRKDAILTYLSSFLSWAVSTFKKNSNVFLRTGILTSLAHIFKYGPRDLLLPFTNPIVQLCVNHAGDKHFSRNGLLRKLLAKVSQRVALVCLKQGVASWRYQRGCRSIETNLGIKQPASNSSNNIDLKCSDTHAMKAVPILAKSTPVDVSSQEKYDEVAEEEVSENIEEAIALLMEGLRDTDTIVRWSAAKGLGRITDRLPKVFASEVVSAVLDIFRENTFPRSQQLPFLVDSTDASILDLSAVSDSAWHGACLAIAEFARRGLLLPEKLPEVIVWVKQALTFDIRRGAHSVGAHVRDAACYVCWSFARAYAPDVMQPHVLFLAPSLVASSVYDREINVRRAASAAFQENVGRQGIFPHGIDIVTKADFFTIGNRANAFLDVSLEIAKFPEYGIPLANYLTIQSCCHWDKNIRELAAGTLSKLAPLEPLHFISLLQFLISQASSTDLPTRHGSLLAIGEIVLFLSHLQPLPDNFKDIQPRVLQIIHEYPEHFLQNFGSEITLEGVCRFIACIGRSKFTLDEAESKRQVTRWLQLLTMCLERQEKLLQETAAQCVGKLLAHQSTVQFSGIVHEWLYKILPHAEKLGRRGYALALGELLYKGDGMLLRTVLAGLMAATAIQDKMYNDAEAKCNAMLAIGKLLSTHQHELASVVSYDLYSRLIECMLKGIQDYSIDQRGDVGSWVRQASMNTLTTAIHVVVNEKTVTQEYLPIATYTRIVAAILQQSAEKIDCVREVAGHALRRILYYNDLVEQALLGPVQKVIMNNEINWLFPGDVYALLAPLLNLPSMRQGLLTGIAISVGGLTKSLVTASSDALMAYLDTLPFEYSINFSLNEFGETLVSILRENERNDRVIVAVFELLDLVYSNDIMYRITKLNIHTDIHDQCKIEMTKCRDPRKLLAGTKIFVALTGTTSAYTQAMSSLLTLLTHAMPRVRNTTAETLFGSLHIYLDTMETAGHPLDVEVTEQAEKILSEFDWNEPIDKVKIHQEQLRVLLQVVT